MVNDPKDPYDTEPPFDEDHLLLGDVDDVVEYHKTQDEIIRARNKKTNNIRGNYRKIPGIGDFITPTIKEWQPYREAVIDTAKLNFSPSIHSKFDRIIAEVSGIPALIEPDKKKYAKYQPMRENLAVLRNYFANHFFPDGQFNPEDIDDVDTMQYMKQIAADIGEMLKNGASVFPTILGNEVNFKKANTEHEGAKELYQKLYNIQKTRRNTHAILAPVRVLKGEMDSNWNIPHILETPFKEQHISSDLPPEISTESDINPALLAAGAAGAAAIANISDDIIMGKGEKDEYRSVDSLDASVKEEAIIEARKILKRLRVTGADIEIDSLQSYQPDDFAELMDDAGKVVETLYLSIEEAQQRFGDEIAETPEISQATDAAAKLGAQYKIFALKQAEQSGDTALASKLAKEINELPAEWRTPSEVTLRELVDQLSTGLEYTIAKLQAVELQTTEQNEIYMERDGGKSASDKKYDEEYTKAKQIEFNQQHNERRQESPTSAKLGGGIASTKTKNTTQLSDAKPKTGKQQEFGNLLAKSDMAKLRGSINTKSSGDMSVAAPNSAKKMVADELRKGAKESKQATKQKSVKNIQKQQRISQVNKLQDQAQESKLSPATPYNPKDKGTSIY